MPEYKQYIDSYDIDGVIYLGDNMTGLMPRKEDVIITGRSFQEMPETNRMLELKGIKNKVFYNSLAWDKKNRVSSGQHKGDIIFMLYRNGIIVRAHWEDDLVQIAEIEKIIELNNLPTKVFHVNTNGLVELENIRHK